MTMNSTNPKDQWGRVITIITSLAALWLACSGCQTFNMTDEQFARQQRGEMVDREVGEVVGVAASLGYAGAVLGKAVAEIVGK